MKTLTTLLALALALLAMMPLATADDAGPEGCTGVEDEWSCTGVSDECIGHHVEMYYEYCYGVPRDALGST